ncbi:MAG: LysR family transcriptional regulator [Bdellovibrionales bacterium]
MQAIHYELSVLQKAIHHKNLSAAALHVGLSQPQLSRIIAKLEDELKVVLLDRSAKRKSGWTPIALQVAEIFEKTQTRLESELKTVSNDQMLNELRVGSLEGMADFALRLVQMCFDKIKVKKVFIDIYDLSELESHFLSGDLDLIFSFKSPGRQKYKHFLEIGYQRLDRVESNPHIGVYSTLEINTLGEKEKGQFSHSLISNSLLLRKEWLKNIGGTGLLPSEAKRGKSKDQEPVYLIGSELLNPSTWQEITLLTEKL